jgi:integrase
MLLLAISPSTSSSRARALARLPPKPTSDYKPVHLTREEVEAVIAKLPTRKQRPRCLPVREFFTVMWATSFRLGTMARLRWEDVDLQAGVIAIPGGDPRPAGQPVGIGVDLQGFVPLLRVSATSASHSTMITSRESAGPEGAPPPLSSPAFSSSSW